MTSVYKRRDFIKNMSLFGISMDLAPSVSIGNLFSDDQYFVLKNSFLTVQFNRRTGRLTVLRNDDSTLIHQASSRINLAKVKRSVSDGTYNHTGELRSVNDNIGKGSRLEVYSKDTEKQIDLKINYTLYDNLNCLFVETSCKNVSGKGIIIKGIEPVCAIEEIGAFLSGSPDATVLTNGPMYYDAGRVIKPGENYSESNPYGPIKGGSPHPEFIYPAGSRIESWWNVAVFNGYDREAMVCGFIENKSGFGRIILSRGSRGSLSLYTESVFAEATQLGQGQEISSGKFVISLSENPYAAVEDFAALMAAINSARRQSIINGWCSWFYTYEFITEEEVVRNAEFISHRLKPYGLEYVQIDEGYQRYHGEWEGNERFPHGMKWLAGRIRDYGLKPGIWFAPFVISEPAEVFTKHPDWLLRNSRGELMRVGPWPDEDTDWARNEKPRRYGLDISHPDAQKWLFNLFDTAANIWGYDMFKIDFVAWSVLSAHHFYDASYTPARAYRKGMEIIRSAIGNEKHINDCGPGPVTTGLIDSMRIEVDQNYGFSEAAWKQYFLDSSSSAPAAAKRYYFNKRTWTNDADHVCISLLSIPQAQAAATLIALSGGNIISGDRLVSLDNSRLEILKKIYPSYGEAARPVDLLDTDLHRVFSLRINKSFGEWTLAGIFNTDRDGLLTKTIPLVRLGLDPAKTYIGYDFWMERLHGEISGDLRVSVAPAGVTLLALHEKKGIPQFISTDRHVLQGACELDDFEWDKNAGMLRGLSSGVANTEYNVIIYIPDGLKWRQGGTALYKDYDGYSVRQVDANLLKVRLRFGDAGNLSWNIDLEGLK